MMVKLNFLPIYTIGILIFGLLNVCRTAVVVKFSNSNSINTIYKELKDKNIHLGHLIAVSDSQKVNACKDRRQGNYSDNPDELKLHVYKVAAISNQQKSEEDIAFKCSSSGGESDFLLSYGFAQRMYFISQLGDKNDIALTGIMYSTPAIEDIGLFELEKQYVELRERTESVRLKSEALLNDIEEHDDISALIEIEKIILCASVFELKYYKDQDLKFVPVPENVNFIYEKLEVRFELAQFESKKYNTDCLKCTAKKGTSDAGTVHYWVTRSYRDQGYVYVVKEHKNEHYIDKYVKNVAVLINRKFFGDHQAVIEMV